MRSKDGMLFLDYFDGLQESRSKLSCKVFVSSCLDMKIYDAERYTLIVEVEIPFIATCTINSSRVSSDAAASSKSLPTVAVSSTVGRLGNGYTSSSARCPQSGEYCFA